METNIETDPFRKLYLEMKRFTGENKNVTEPFRELYPELKRCIWSKIIH